jgi:hypothetical protein
VVSGRTPSAVPLSFRQFLTLVFLDCSSVLG